MKIGVICPSEIAFRRFMPALQQLDQLEFVGLGVSTKQERFGDVDVDSKVVERVLGGQYEKAKKFTELYGGKVFDGYQNIATSDEIDALYLPLPPALHYRWAKIALESGKHVLIEKPATLSADDSQDLVKIAQKNQLAIHENYMFVFHDQLKAIHKIIASGEIGDVRLYRISFGFPMRASNDFRYNKALGGGALIDAGGYTLKYAMDLLGESATIRCAQMNYIDGFEVDMYGSATITNDAGQTAQIAFGMDNNYKCDLEVWGSKGCLKTGRVLTAPAGFIPTVVIRKGNEEETRSLPADDAFKKSIQHFLKCVQDEEYREDNYRKIVSQARLVDEFKTCAGQ